MRARCAGGTLHRPPCARPGKLATEGAMGHQAGEIERIRSSRPQFRTLRIEGREWRHCQRLGEAFMRNHRGGAMMVGISLDEQEAEERNEVWRMWIEAPDRRRVEFGLGQAMVAAVFQ